MLAALAAIWGAAFMLIEIGLRDLPPGALIAGRLGSAAVTLWIVVALRGRLTAALAGVRPFAGQLAVAALVNTALPFFLIAWGQQYVDSGVAAILSASAPLFTVLLAALVVRSERVRGIQLAGFLLGFSGVVLVVGGRPGDAGVLGALAVVAGAACYAAGALYVSHRLADLSPLDVAVGLLTWSAVFTAPAFFGLGGREVGWESAAAVLALGVLATAVAFQLYFALIAGAGAPKAMLVTYLVPASALVYGVTLLGEPLTAFAVGGLALVLAGVGLGTGAVRPRVASSA